MPNSRRKSDTKQKVENVDGWIRDWAESGLTDSDWKWLLLLK